MRRDVVAGWAGLLARVRAPVVPPVLAAAALAAACAWTLPAAQAQERVTPLEGRTATPAGPLPGRAVPDRPRVALVLSGGGARGFAHIGVLKVLKELDVPVDLVTGTSMGAIVGGAYAAGYSPEALERLVTTTDWDSIFAKRAPRELTTWRRKEDDFLNLSDFELGIRPDGLTLPRGLAGTQRLELFLRALGGPVKEVRDLGRLPLPFTAMATDLATGKGLELQADISLSAAMRASMAVPGVFPPVEYRGQVLVDGGIVDNLPVAAARRRGAEIVIAVNVGTALQPAQKLRDVVSVADQLTRILGIESVERAIATLGPQDILITPEFSELASSDFDDNAAMIGAGEAAALQVVDRLRALAATPEQYAAWDGVRSRMVAADGPVTLAGVRVQPMKTVNPAAVQADVDVPLDRPVTTHDIEQAAQRLWGSGDFEAVNYSLLGPPASPTLVFTPYEKSWGYNTLRFGGRMQTNFREASTFDGIVAHTWRWLNAWGGEWRNELRIGDTRGVATEFYQPLGPGSRWFLLPRVSYARTQQQVFLRGNDTPVAVASTVQVDGGLALGYEFDRYGYASLGRTRSLFDGSLVVTPVPIAIERTWGTSWDLKVVIDTLDSVNFPRSGTLLRANVRDYGQQVGSSQRSRSADARLIRSFTFDRWTTALTAQAGRSVQAGTYRLGGLFNLSGTPTGSVSGSRMVGASVLAFRNVSDALGDLKVPIYVGASVEAGNAVDAGERLGSWAALRKAGAVFVAGDTPVGPVYLAFGRTRDGRSAVYLFWGRF